MPRHTPTTPSSPVPSVKQPPSDLEDWLRNAQDRLRTKEQIEEEAFVYIRDMPGWMVALLAVLCALALPTVINIIVWMWP